MTRSLWKPALVVFAVIALALAFALIPWHRLLYSQEPAELVSSEHMTIAIDAPMLRSRIEQNAARKELKVTTGKNGPDGKLYAQVSYGSCLMAVQQMSAFIYQVDYYALNGSDQKVCENRRFTELIAG